MTGRVTAQTLTTLYNIGNSDAANPYAGLILSGNTLYGTTYSYYGTVFSINTNGTGFTNLYNFTGGTNGAYPYAGVIASGNTLYGTAYDWGTLALGSVFKVNTDGTDFTNLYNFTGGSDGGYPVAGLLLSGNTLYGTARNGGNDNAGTVFKINIDGTHFASLHSFTGNGDGGSPVAGLILSGNTLYGTTEAGGQSGDGTVFAINTDGTGFTNLYSFTGGNDGANPQAGLILSANTLYGTAPSGGNSGYGTVFAINTDGTGFTNLYSFTGGNDGSAPNAGLLLSGNTLYGTAYGGGSSGNGAIFEVNIDGTGFTSLHNFSATAYGFNSDGAHPGGSLILSDDTLYGTTEDGGVGNAGTVFGISLALAVNTTSLPSGTNGVNYSQTLAAFGGKIPYSWSSPDSMPAGLTLTTNGAISGIPTSSGDFCFTIQVIDASAETATQTVCLTIQDAPQPPVVINYSVAESWSVTIAEDNGETPTFSKTYTGTSTGMLSITNGNYSLIDQLPLGLEGSNLDTAATVYYDGASYSIQGNYYPVSGFDGDYAVVQLGFFVFAVKLPVNNYYIPVLNPFDSEIYSMSGSSLNSLSGSGYETDDDGFTASATSTASLTQIVDTQKPTLSVITPTAGLRVSNAVFTVTGKASDNVGVEDVFYSLNGSAWAIAATVNNWTNWNAGVTLMPGTNVVQAYAMDTSGNLSMTNSVSFQFVETSQLGMRAIGLGTISPNYSNAWLQIGSNYAITSAPASGFVFTNWTVSTNWIDGTTMTGTKLQFMMESNLTLQANFVETNKPTLTITAPAAGKHMTNALATVTGTTSDKWGVSGVWYQLNNGAWNASATTNGWTNWATTVELISGTNTVKAYAQNLGGNVSTNTSVSMVSSNTFMLQLALTNAMPLKTNGLVYSLELSSGLNGHIQVSTNLISWVLLTNFAGTNSTLIFHDPEATNFGHRFYRAVIP